MKKIMLALLMVMMISGCSSSADDVNTMFVEGAKNKLALCTYSGELKTKFEYDKYQSVSYNGYLVTKGNINSFISNKGKVLIKGNKDTKLEVLGNMVVKTDKDKTITIYNSEGEKLESSSKKVKITISGLPIIYKDKEYYVLDLDGNQLTKSKNKIVSTSIAKDSYVSVNFADKIKLFNLVEGTTSNNISSITTKLYGNYAVYDQDYKDGYVLYNETTHKLAVVNVKGKVLFDDEIDLDEVSFKNSSLIAKKGNNTYVISLDGKTKATVNSYYNSVKNYLSRNDDYVYGPHIFSNNGKTQEVTGIQVNPITTYISSNIFPVYVKDKGYQYYTFKGKQAFDKNYKEAGEFDVNKLAIASKDGKDYYLIDKNGKNVSNKYVAIENLDNGYYAGYKTFSKYEVIDSTGKKVIDNYFMGENSVVVYNDVTLGVFNKSGTTYVYNMEDYKVVFSLEGEFKFNEDGYFEKSDHKAYYDTEGNLIYKR